METIADIQEKENTSVVGRIKSVFGSTLRSVFIIFLLPFLLPYVLVPYGAIFAACAVGAVLAAVIFPFKWLVCAIGRALGVWENDTEDEDFCRAWAEASSTRWVFDVDRSPYREFPWWIRFYDLHGWAGKRRKWVDHEVEDARGHTRRLAWLDMAAKIVEYEGASSREEALLKAEIAMRRTRPRGWMQDAYDDYDAGKELKDPHGSIKEGPRPPGWPKPKRDGHDGRDGQDE